MSALFQESLQFLNISFSSYKKVLFLLSNMSSLSANALISLNRLYFPSSVSKNVLTFQSKDVSRSTVPMSLLTSFLLLFLLTPHHPFYSFLLFYSARLKSKTKPSIIFPPAPCPHFQLLPTLSISSSYLFPLLTFPSSTALSLSEIKTKQRRRQRRKQVLLPSPEAVFLIMRQAERPFTGSDRWSRYNTRTDCFLLSFVVLPHPTSPLLLCFRLVLTLMLTKRFVKQDLLGGEDEKTDKSEVKERRSSNAAAFDTGTVTQCLKCQARFLWRCVDGVRGSLTASHTDIQSLEKMWIIGFYDSFLTLQIPVNTGYNKIWSSRYRVSKFKSKYWKTLIPILFIETYEWK